MSSQPTQKDAFEFAKRFAGLLIDAQYSQARGLLEESSARQWGLAELTHAWVTMVEDPSLASMMPEVIDVSPVNDFPNQTPQDVAWIYVPILTPFVNEAVSGIVVSTNEGLRLRALEFGRP